MVMMMMVMVMMAMVVVTVVTGEAEAMMVTPCLLLGAPWLFTHQPLPGPCRHSSMHSG
jgi:hypothetical protein